jgi:hypothetical protein|tara:strand:+ start:205 stop:846 length:642 start_codon:yes stop_codon:yes gene_type:complete
MKKTIVLTIMMLGFIIASTNDGPVVVTTSGTVPFVVSFNSDGTAEDTGVDFTPAAGDFALIGDDDYDRQTNESVTNYMELADIMVVSDFDANHKFKINLLKGAWTLPANYTTAGDATLRKNTGGTDVGQLLVKVNVSSAGYSDATEGLIQEGSFGTAYTGLDEVNTTIIAGGRDSHGVEDGAFDIDARILFDWLVDIPGAYAVDLTISVVQGD